MNPRVYIETTFVSYLTARPSRDLIIAAHQQLTHEWWDTCREKFELCASQLVLKEASAGDPEAARLRIEVLTPMTMLDIIDPATDLAELLVKAGALPPNAQADALHVAIAASHGIPYLLTWNCRHLANAVMRPLIESVCSQMRLVAPIICNPEELMGTKP